MSIRSQYNNWDNFRENLINSTVVEIEDIAQQKKRVAKLEANPEEWFKYYFPNYYSSEPAKFHKDATKRWLANERWYEVRRWSRELAKTARAMMEDLFLIYTGKAKNKIQISSTETAAINILTPYRINIESNLRLKNDYGEQVMPGYWEESHFKMRNKASFLAIGAGQSPRGTRNEEVRPDILDFDDIDTDEEVRNPERIQKKWDWIEQAVIPTVSVSGKIRIRFNGNIIGKDTCITRASKNADYVSTVNIRDANGISSWSRNSEEHIDWLLSKLSYASQQKEYFNNPITIGTIFKTVNWGQIPRKDSFKFLIKYGDPSYSNNTKAKENSHKCVVLMGKKDKTYYIITCRLDKATNNQFVDWYNDIKASYPDFNTYDYVENNSLQNPFFEQLLKPAFNEKNINIHPDDRKKTDKFFRVETNLEPINRDGKLILNIAEKDNPHMKMLEDHFISYSAQTANKLDGPDTVEGAKYIIDNKLIELTAEDINIHKFKKNKRF